MIEAPHVLDIPPQNGPLGSIVAAPAPSKTSLLIAAYRAARLSQRQTLQPGTVPIRSTPPGEAEVAADAPVDTIPGGDRAVDPGMEASPVKALSVPEQPDIEPENDPAAVTPDATAETASAVETLPTIADLKPAADRIEQSAATAAQMDMHAAADTGLARIGLGPCMMIRLNQLGMRSIDDVARANAGDLRSALGGISRLVDVEAWIAVARHLTGASLAAL